MKQRAVETLFKRKLLILLPLLIIVPLSVMFALRPRPQQWQAFAVIWVDQYRPLYQDERLGYTPAANQSQLLNDFLHTRGFALTVLQQTRLADDLTDSAAEDQLVRQLWGAVAAWPTSNNFITIMVTTSSGALSHEIAKAVVAQYQTVLRDRLETQSKAALALYADALAKAEQQLNKSRNELAAYVAASPQLTDRRPDSGVLLEARDPQFARLTVQVNNDQDLYRAMKDRYETVKATGAAGLEGQELAFSVVDEPRQPLQPVPHSRLGLIRLPLIGIVVALMLSSAIAVFFIVTNRAVLGAQDIDSTLGLPVIGEIPELRRRRRPWQRAPRDAVRLRVVAPARVPPAASGM
jgi:capsular polysaccharide biosynthesis protein